MKKTPNELELLREKIEYLATQQAYYRKSLFTRLGVIKNELAETKREVAALKAAAGFKEWEDTPLFENLKEVSV